MKNLKLFFALFAMLALGVGNAWGAEETITLSTFGWSNASVQSSISATTATITLQKNSAGTAPTYYTSDGLRLYGVKSATTGGTISFTPKTGITISKIVFTHTASNSGVLAIKTGTGTYTSSSKTWSGTLTEGNTVSLVSTNSTNKNPQVKITKIVITYETSGSEETTPSLTADPTTIEFGTVYQDATVADKTVAVNFANLTGDVTYSGLSTPFTATGAISATGDKITISADASTIGEYSQTLTIASTADSKTAVVTVRMNVVEKPAPTGTFTLHTGELIEGDYVIVDGTNAMNNTVTSNRLQYNSVTITNNEIVDPLAATIWHIAPNGEYWTVYSADVNKYAASTNDKNQATLAASVSDNTKWTVTMSGNTFDFENLARSNGSDSSNKYLRKNGSYGFACYASGTGAKLSLYRKAGAKYDVTVNSTTNGTVTADPTSAEAGTTITLTVTPDGGYVLDALTVTDANSNSVTVTDNTFTMPAADVTISATFKENEKPAATLTLSKNGVAETFPGSWKQDDVVTLPSITSDCVKEFVGWSANPTCKVAPEYAAGDSYTLTATAQTLYAVYATAGAGETLTITPSAVDNDAENDIHTFTIDAAGYSLTAKKNSGSSAPTINASAKDVRIYAKGTVTLTAPKALNTIVFNISTQGKKRLAPITASVGAIATQASGDATVTWTGDATEVTFTVGDNANYGSESDKAGQLCFGTIKVTTAGSYSNYSTTCATAPIVTVTPETVTANSTGAEGKVTVTYENVNTENVAVALFNDAACTEAFNAGWLTASFDGDKNITYTVAENTTYAERKAYIKLTAPETTGAIDPAVVVIPVTQAGKDKVFASLEELLANITPTEAATKVTVTLTKEPIVEIYVSGTHRNGIYLNVPYQGENKKIEIYCWNVPATWVLGGSVSGTLTNCDWKDYNGTWELCPADWSELTYTAPATVSSIAVSGTPTTTTYVDGEKFDPAGLVVTATYSDATTENVTTYANWTITPATLTKGQTAVNVTATYNSISSAAYEVTGLTVNDIPTKTVAEFIAAGGTRCYLEGIVSGLTEGNNMKYGNFDLTDASGTIYVYGCLNEAGEKQKFAELGVKNGDKIKVIADEYELYGGTKDEAKNVQYVSHISAASITIANITMEVDEVATITATVDPADAVVTYTIKENAANAISLSGNTITALAEGTATITATVAEGATYLSNSVDFTVTVGPKSEKVVILAEYNGQWYAMKAQYVTDRTSHLAPLPVTYFDGKLYNVSEEDKALIEWERAVVDGKATFYNDGKYLTGKSDDTNLTLAATACEWTISGDSYLIGARTFLYNAENNWFRNFGTGNAGNKNYSGMPTVTAPVYATGDIVYTRTVTNGRYGTICLPYASSNYTGMELYEVSWLKAETGLYLDQLEAGAQLEAGTPYIFRATASEITVTCTGKAETAPATGANGLTGTFTDIAAGGVLVGHYIIAQNQIWVANDQNTLPANRAYIANTVPKTEQAKLPGRRRVCMGENTTTNIDNITNSENTTIKVIENGQLIIIRNGEKFNAQGIKL